MTSLSQEGLGGVTGEDAGSEDSPAGTEENTFFKDGAQWVVTDLKCFLTNTQEHVTVAINGDKLTLYMLFNSLF